MCLINISDCKNNANNIHEPSEINITIYMAVSKNRGEKPKMDGENHGSKAYLLMDDLGVKTCNKNPIFGKSPHQIKPSWIGKYPIPSLSHSMGL